MTDSERPRLSSYQLSLIFLILALAGASVAYRLIVWKRLEQTSLMFIGLPALLAVVLAVSPKAKTVMGGIMRGITLFLLLSGVLLGEGFICIVMAAPLFYLVGGCVGAIVQSNRKRFDSTTRSFLLLLLLLPMSLEGLSPALSFNRDEAVEVSQIVSGSPGEIQQALGGTPRMGLPLPLFLRMGFPHPMSVSGTGLEVGKTRTIHFAGGEGRPGDLVLQVEESRPGYLRYAALSDRSKIAHWLAWRTSEVSWVPVDAQHTRVTWTLRFERRLDPAWYFGPWERYAARLAATALIQASATPASAGAKR